MKERSFGTKLAEFERNDDWSRLIRVYTREEYGAWPDRPLDNEQQYDRETVGCRTRLKFPFYLRLMGKTTYMTSHLFLVSGVDHGKWHWPDTFNNQRTT